MSDINVDTELIRKMADSVKVGECITFPNGYVIDKRASYASPASPTILSQGGPR